MNILTLVVSPLNMVEFRLRVMKEFDLQKVGIFHLLMQMMNCRNMLLKRCSVMLINTAVKLSKVVMMLSYPHL